MKMWIRGAAFSALALILVPPAEAAESKTGDYIAIRVIGGFSEVDGFTENDAGTLQINNSEDVTAGLGIALGYDWSTKGVPFRSELAYHHRFRFDFDYRITNGAIVRGYENNLRTDVFLVNLFYDIDLQSSWQPHLGGGIGWALNTAEVKVNRIDVAGAPQEEREDTTNSLAWWLGAGLGYRWSERWWMEMTYRYIDLGKFESGPFSNGTVVKAEEYVSHDILVGLQYRF